MDRLMTPEMSINVLSRYISYPASSSSLSSLPLSEFSDIMSQIEEEIGNDTDEKGLDGEDGKMEINDEMGVTSAYKQSIDRRYYYIRRKLQMIIDVLYSIP